MLKVPFRRILDVRRGHQADFIQLVSLLQSSSMGSRKFWSPSSRGEWLACTYAGAEFSVDSTLEGIDVCP